MAFLNGDDKLGERRWSGTLLTDRYSAYDTVVDPGAVIRCVLVNEIHNRPRRGMLSPKTLRIAAAAVILGPLGECLVGSYNLASGLMLATIGGSYIAVLGILVSPPLLIGAYWLSRLQPPTQ